jgi:hypothetical protein
VDDFLLRRRSRSWQRSVQGNPGPSRVRCLETANALSRGVDVRCAVKRHRALVRRWSRSLRAVSVEHRSRTHQWLPSAVRGASRSLHRPSVSFIRNGEWSCRYTSSPMPWTCPACSTQVQHERWRCHLCGYELVADENGNARNAATPIELRLQQDRRQQRDRRQFPRPGRSGRRASD